MWHKCPDLAVVAWQLGGGLGVREARGIAGESQERGVKVQARVRNGDICKAAPIG